MVSYNVFRTQNSASGRVDHVGTVEAFDADGAKVEADAQFECDKVHSLFVEPADPTEDAIRELCILTTRDSSGRHFTQWSGHYEQLEACGLVTINRPVHQVTGIPYSQEYWSVEVTSEGQDAVDSNPELHPDID